MEANLNILAKGRRHKFLKLEDDLNILANGRQHQYFGKMEDEISFLKLEDLLCNKQRDHPLPSSSLAPACSGHRRAGCQRTPTCGAHT